MARRSQRSLSSSGTDATRHAFRHAWPSNTAVFVPATRPRFAPAPLCTDVCLGLYVGLCVGLWLESVQTLRPAQWHDHLDESSRPSLPCFALGCPLAPAHPRALRTLLHDPPTVPPGVRSDVASERQVPVGPYQDAEPSMGNPHAMCGRAVKSSKPRRS